MTLVTDYELRRYFKKGKKFEKYVRLDWSTMDINTPYLKPYHIEVQEITDQTSYIPFARPKEDDFFNL